MDLPAKAFQKLFPTSASLIITLDRKKSLLLLPTQFEAQYVLWWAIFSPRPGTPWGSRTCILKWCCSLADPSFFGGTHRQSWPWSIDRQKGLLCSPLTKCLSSCQEIHRVTWVFCLGTQHTCCCLWCIHVGVQFFSRVGELQYFFLHDFALASEHK